MLHRADARRRASTTFYQFDNEGNVSARYNISGSPITGAIKAISGCDYVGGSSVSTQDRVNDGINAGVALLFAEFPETESELELCENDGCFIAGTPVQLANGKTKQIQKVRVEDRVVTRNSVTGKTEIKRVARLYVHLAHETITVRFADVKTGKVLESLTATPEHPFFVPGLGAVPLGKLGIGMLIFTRAGPLVKIASLVRHEYPNGIPVYNFEAKVDQVSVAMPFSDLEIHFDNGVVLQTFSDSEKYEHWSFVGGPQEMVIAGPGRLWSCFRP